MPKLYQAQPLTDFKYLQGRKGNKAVHIGPLNPSVTMEEGEKVVIECRTTDFNKVDILGWEWSYEVNELAKARAKGNEVVLKITDFQIPPAGELAQISSKVKDPRDLMD